MKNPIVITGAMEDVELNILKNELQLKNVVKEKMCTFYEGVMFEYPVVLCHTNVGVINSVAATILAIKKYNPISIIVQGVAGAHNKEIHKGDLVVGTSVINMNSIKTGFKKEGEGANTFEWQLVNYGMNRKEVKYFKSNDTLIKCAQRAEKQLMERKVWYGVIGSGDIWNREVDRILHFSKVYDTLCEEMESIGVFQIAELYDIPTIEVRAISNNEILEEEYDRTLGCISQEFTKSLIKEYIKLENL